MTPPAATAAARSHPRRPARASAPRTARRVSGASRRPLVAGPQDALLAPPRGLRVAERIATLPDSRLLDRLARGRVWIAILAVALVGIVFLQISLLKLNTGISRAVQTTQTLERQNTELKLDLSRLAGGERVQDSAAAMGFVSPATGQPRFLDARRADATRAAASITAPDPVEQLPLGMIPPAQGGTAGVTPDPTVAVAPAAAAGVASVPGAAPAASAGVESVAGAAPVAAAATTAGAATTPPAVTAEAPPAASAPPPAAEPGSTLPAASAASPADAVTPAPPATAALPPATGGASATPGG